MFTSKRVKARHQDGEMIYFEHPLMLRLTDGDKRKHISLKVSLPPERWDFAKGEYIPKPITRGMSKEDRARVEQENAEIRELITGTLTKYNRKISELARAQKNITLDSLRDKVDKVISREYTVFKWIEQLIREFKAADKIGQARVYTDALKAFKSFRNDKDIDFSEIDIPFLNRYENYLTGKKLKVASISLYMRTLRAAVAKAVKLGYARDFAFSEYKIPTGKPNKRALSAEDMDKLLNHEDVNKENDNYRIMAFIYFTAGMNFVDVCRLKFSDIRGNEIHYIRQKIHYKMIIPVHPRVKEIISYRKKITIEAIKKQGGSVGINGIGEYYIFGTLGRNSSGGILSKELHKTEAQIMDRIMKKRTQFNQYLKRVGTTAKIETPLSSYVLRHTAITNLARAGATVDAIQALGGHKKLTTTENYIREASQEQKNKAVNML